MEGTPKKQSADSGCFDLSLSGLVFESTPRAGSQSTPISVGQSRKRKFSCFSGGKTWGLSEAVGSCPASPQASSTYNESFLEVAHKIEKNEINEEVSSKKFHSAPNTPEKQICSTRSILRKSNTSSVIKNFALVNFNSPLNKESLDIIYPQLPPLDPPKKTCTPQKIHHQKNLLLYKKGPICFSRRDLFKQVFTNELIMNKIFKCLSDGDLYRLSQVTGCFKRMIEGDAVASKRYSMYMKEFKVLKENYRITPPSSPEQNENLEASPRSRNYQIFIDFAKQLNKNQTLTKCPSCGKPSIVENNIAYCQSLNSCGYIFCQRCNSCAHNPSDFKDKCNRHLLGDLSNADTSDYYSGNNSSLFSSFSLNLNNSTKYSSSGTFSESNTSIPIQKVKRNLSKTFSTSSETKGKILSSNNNKNIVSSVQRVPRRRISIVPVTSGMETPKKPIEPPESSSPPRVKQYSACSKQSRKSLKRLTR